MKQEKDEMSLEDALRRVKTYILEANGLFAHIEQEGKLDQRKAQEIEQAFQVMKDAWQDQGYVPKHAVQVIHEVAHSLAHIEKQLQTKSGEYRDVIDFCLRMYEWIENTFSPIPLTEEAALVSVCQHLLGTPLLAAELFRGRFDQSNVKDLVESLDVLAQAWRTQKDLPKIAAYALVGDAWLFQHVAHLFPGEKQHMLHEAEHTIYEHIQQCLR